MTTNTIHTILALLADKKNLPLDTATRAFQIIMNGGATPAQMAAFVTALRLKGETVEEITGGAMALRAKCTKFNAPVGAIDPCGTGGDAKGTYNISTAVAFVLAACGVPVAKAGNRAVSSASGSADVLKALGVNVDAEPAVMERCIRELNIAFLLAPKYHPAVRHISPVRQELGFRTIFNLLGPISNPANLTYQFMGVYDKKWLEPLAHAMKELGLKRAWIVHGNDGLDELTLSGASTVAELKDGAVHSFEITPEEAGLQGASLDELKGGNAEHNAAALKSAISGMESAYRRSVLYNTAAALLVAEKVHSLKEGVAMAAESIDSGDAHKVLMKFVDMSNTKA
ncbi:MAG: anthranilate phosphoribosyltransferase [Alphaproteobacteria bacterium]